MQIDLYYAPFSCALVPFILLTEAGIPFTVRPLNIRGNENKLPNFIALNPKQKVPLLVVDQKPLSENVAIQLWIARHAPLACLLPSDTWDEAQAISLIAWFASGVHPHISRYNAPLKFCDASGSSERTRQIAGEMLLANLRLADQMLEGRSFFFDQFTAADAYLFWCVRRAGFFPDLNLSQFGNISAHTERLSNKPSVAQAVEYDTKLRKQFNLLV